METKTINILLVIGIILLVVTTIRNPERENKPTAKEYSIKAAQEAPALSQEEMSNPTNMSEIENG